MPEESGQKSVFGHAPRVAMIVLNPCVMDARVIKTAEAVASGGYNVRVFCTLPNNGRAPAYEIKNGVTYVRMQWRPRQIVMAMLFPKFMGEMKIARLLAIRLFPFFKYRAVEQVFAAAVREFKPEIIHAHDLVPLPFASRLARELNAKVIYDAHELEVHRNPPLPIVQKAVVRTVEKKYGSRADEVITVGDMISDILKAELKRDRVWVVYNAPPVEPVPGLSTLRDDCGLFPHHLLIVYVGKITINRGIENILHALPGLPDVHFAAVGPCGTNERKETLGLAEALDVSDRFHLIDPVHYSNVVQYISSANLGVLPIVPLTKSYELSMPNKLFEMSLARLPIVAADLPEIGKFIRRFRNGRLYDPANVEILPSMLMHSILTRKQMNLSDNAYDELMHNYSWAAQRRKLLEIYKGLIPADMGRTNLEARPLEVVNTAAAE